MFKEAQTNSSNYYPYSNLLCTFRQRCQLTIRSLTYNHFMDQSYAADVCMEPLFWFVDNFTHVIGPVSSQASAVIDVELTFLPAVCNSCCCTHCFRGWNCVLDRSSLLVEQKSLYVCYTSHCGPLVANKYLISLLYGCYSTTWVSASSKFSTSTLDLKLFTCSACFQGELISEAVSICKKCISPKPPRTHHCSVCNRCILKMDHHCRILSPEIPFDHVWVLFICYLQ